MRAFLYWWYFTNNFTYSKKKARRNDFSSFVLRIHFTLFLASHFTLSNVKGTDFTSVKSFTFSARHWLEYSSYFVSPIFM